MLALSGYQITEQIYDGATTLIYRGIRESDGRPAIVKIFKTDYPSLGDIARMRQEYEITASLDIEGIVKALALENYGNGLALILEDIGGISLKQFLGDRPLPLSEFLPIAVQIADALGQLHQKQIIHKDIKPQNLIVNPESKTVKIADFSIASRLSRENPAPSNPKALEGTLAYMSPEQTGRMNRSLDYRTDFYSLGATFYELLTGRMPFNSSDPMELVHCHIAKQPVPASHNNSEIPPAVSAIVMKLLAKTAEERYQSAPGLKIDLQNCLQQLQTQGKISYFTPGEQDFYGQFTIPQKLYGRDREVEILLRAFDRISALDSSRSEIMLVSGYSGIGKSALIEEIHKPIVRQRGYFVSGKFDQFQRHIPYSAILAALKSLVRQVLTESSGRLERWKTKLLRALGNNGQLVIDVIPELELIIGSQPPAPKLDATESQYRFKRVFVRFIYAFCRPESPLVIFLDDLQWADATSLKLLQLLIADSESKYLLLLGAYRDNEVSATHPLVRTIEEIEKDGTEVSSLVLKPLAIGHVRQLVVDTLHLSRELENQDSPDESDRKLEQLPEKWRKRRPEGRSEGRPDKELDKRLDKGLDKRPDKERSQISSLSSSSSLEKRLTELVELLYNKTQGNPFFLSQILEALYGEKLLVYDFGDSSSVSEKPKDGQDGRRQSSNRGWQWNIEEIQAVGIADYGVVELIARNIQKLPEPSQQVLKLAACIGNKFNLEVLATAMERSPAETAAHLWNSLQAGLVLPLSNAYKIAMFGNGELAAGEQGSREQGSREQGRQGVGEQGAGEQGRQGVGEQKISPLPPSPRPPASNTQFPIYYKFLHDRVQQAAYSLIAEERRKETHFNIGKLLLQNIRPEFREENIFDLVNQLNYGVDSIGDDTAFTKEVAELNLVAGRKAKAAAAYEPALRYFNIGLGLLEAVSWEREYDLTLALHLEAAEAEYLNTNFERSQQLTCLVVERATNLLDRIKAYELQMHLDIAQNKTTAAVDTGLQAVELLGVSLESNNPSKGRPLELPGIAQIEKMPAMTNANKLAAMRLLVALTAPAYQAKPQILPALVCSAIELCIEYGLCAEATYSYAVYGLLLCGPMGKTDPGYYAARLALKLLDILDARAFKCKTYKIFYCHIQHWKDHARETLAPLLEAIQSGLDTGDIEFTSYCINHYCANLFLVGDRLEQVAESQAKYLKLQLQLQHQHSIFYTRIWRQLGLNLQGLAENKLSLTGESFRETETMPVLLEVNNITSLFGFYLAKTILLYLFKDCQGALAAASAVGKYAKGAVGLFTLAVANFYHSLTLLALSAEATPEKREEYLGQVEANQLKLEGWAAKAPTNFQHKYDLVAGEKAGLLGQTLEAMELYDRAIAGARDNGYIQEEALTNERAALFYLALGREKVARTYMTDAYYGYIRWEAAAKAKDLEAEYPQLLERVLAPKELIISNLEVTATTYRVTSTGGSSDVLDLATAIKASQAISREIVLSESIAQLIKIAIENAGAETGLLALERNGELGIVAAGSAGGSLAVNIEQPSPLSSDRLPLSPINYVLRIGESIVLNDAREDERFAADFYIIERQTKSILCAPLLERGKAIGLLYLENNLTTGAFTSDRLQLLELLTAQAAISLNNALLYGQLEDYSHTLEQKVKQRTLELNEKNQDLEKTLEELKQTQIQLVQTEKMSSLGQLVAGIAHEINNPVSFIYGNVDFAREYLQDLLHMLDIYRDNSGHLSAEIQEEIDQFDPDFLLADFEKVLDSMKSGASRIRDIVSSLRNFSRLDEAEMKRADLSEGLDSTLTILQNRLHSEDGDSDSEPKPPEIKIIKDYGHLPKVECYPGQLNQVFMYIISNAIDALFRNWESEEAGGQGAGGPGDMGDKGTRRLGDMGRPGEREEKDFQLKTQNSKLKTQNSKLKTQNSKLKTIRIRTEAIADDMVAIRIADNGPGMPEEVKQRIFDPFFTTKPVGSGTGLGLSVSYQIVVEKHKGQLHCISAPGEGTEFIIQIPIEQGGNRQSTN